MTVDILALAAHPDDVEISCAGTLIKMVSQGKKVAIVDFTEGELGTRGTVTTRYAEAKAASAIMGLHARENLQLGDGFFEVDEVALMKVITAIRKYQPTTLLINAPKDRHPDHGRAAELSLRAAFLSGLPKISTPGFAPHRPKNVFHYIQDIPLEPDVLVDVSPFMEQRMDAVKAYSTQFFDPNSKEPQTPISGENFLDLIQYRCQQNGRYMGVDFAEGFIKTRPFGVHDITELD